MKTKVDDAKIIEDEILPIHPALDFTTDLAIITVPLPTQLLTSNKDDSVSMTVEQKYWVVTDKKEVFRFKDEELLDRGFYPTGICYVMSNRWNYKDSLKLWRQGEKDADLGEIFFRIKEKYEHYLDYVDNRIYTFNAIWVIGTYLFPLFNAYPIVFLNGGSGSGKSKTIDVTEQLAFNAMNTANISDASIYRVIQGTRATLLLDENEKIADPQQAQTLINLVLAGFKKGAKVIRLEKGKTQDFVPTKFEVHCPKMIANIRGMHEEALKNRCIPFIMTPTQAEKSNNYPTGEEADWQDIRNSLYIFTMNHWREIREAKKEVKASEFKLNGYAFMMWHPILTIATYLKKLIGDEPLKEVSALAADKFAERKADLMESIDRQLLLVIKNMVDLKLEVEPDCKDIFLPVTDTKDVFLSIADIRENLRERLDFDKEKPPAWFTPQMIGRKVNSLDVGDKRTANNVRGYRINKDRLNTVINRFGIVDVC